MSKQDNLEVKRVAGLAAAEEVRDGMVVGLGTGSTAHYAILRIGERVREERLSIVGIPTSYQSAMRARAAGIRVADLVDYPEIDLTIDGADQVDADFRLIKGGGAAHTREKCVAAASKRIITVVDPSKLSEHLNVPVPLEVVPYALALVEKQVAALGGTPALREGVKKDGPVITDNGNFVLDCDFGTIADPEGLETKLNALPGVLTCGIFTEFAEKIWVLVGESGGCKTLTRSGPWPSQ
ncbi:ribose 5-phosphate isomerase A [Methanofollis sp. W23]|uniref:ribose-5-phosphate isomerase RpiA n=1 Tax=Methanofollis sp. W23 TaxID=2817849 RepID=UPI001AE44B5D|nr:ribose-5-phosphate isomerase RpiA [Methanofollis sp. W23]MBP2145863.1 ribose 5-phosphate isomerase A [Methanofollis sp. W23]